MYKSSWMMDTNRSREMPSYSAIDLAEIRRSSKIRSWIWSIISVSFTVLGRPGRGASHAEKSPSLYWTAKFWRWQKIVHVTLIFLSERREFSSAPCLAGKKKLDKNSHVGVIEIGTSPYMLPFSLCNKKRLAIRHMNRPLFPTTLSIPSYDIGN